MTSGQGQGAGDRVTIPDVGPIVATAVTAVRAKVTADASIRRITLAAWVIAALAVLAYLWLATWVFEIDLGVYRSGASVAFSGADLYSARFSADQLAFTYPPFAALAFTPLTWMPVIPAQLVWTTGCAACVIALAVVSVHRYLHPPKRWLQFAIAVTVALALVCDPSRIGTMAGQINAILALALVLDLNKLTGRIPQGVLIGLAAGIKLIPLFLIAYFLVTRRPKAALRALVAFAAFSAIGFAILPAASARYWLSDMWDTSRIGSTEDIGNQSVRAMLARLLTTGQESAVLWLILGTMLAGLILWVCSRIWGELPWAADALVFGAMLLLSPVSWCAHWILALPIVLAAIRLGCLISSKALISSASALAAVMVIGPIWLSPRLNVFDHNMPQAILANSYVLAALAAVGVLSARAWLQVTVHKHQRAPVVAAANDGRVRPLRAS